MEAFYSFKDNMAEFKHLVRIANTDLKGQKALVYALKDIKGVGVPFAHAVCSILRIDGLSKIGNISDSDMKRVDEVIKLPEKFGIPFWMFNRQKDIVSSSLLSFVFFPSSPN